MNNISKIIEDYDIHEVSPVTLIRESSDNLVYQIGDGNKKILRVSKHLKASEIMFEFELMSYLDSKGFNVPKWNKTKNGDMFVSCESSVSVMFDFVDGYHATIDKDFFSNDNNQAFEAGKSLAQLSNIGRDFKTEHVRSRRIFSELQRVIDNEERFKSEFEGGKEFVEQVKESIKFAKSSNAHIGVIHNDFRASNVIFGESGTVKSVVDFDWACFGPLIKDAALGVLEWSFPDGYTEFDAKTFDLFLEGYNSVAETKVVKDTDLYKWIMFSALSDTATFFCDRIDSTTLRKNINYSYMYRKYLYFRNLQA